MKVRDLQEKLSKLDPGLEVVCYSEDEKLLTGNQGFILLDILAVDTSEGERNRLDDGFPSMTFGSGPNAEVVATLEVTSDF